MARQKKIGTAEDTGRLNLKFYLDDPEQKNVKCLLDLLARKKSEYIGALIQAHLKELGIADASLLQKKQAKAILNDALLKSFSQTGMQRIPYTVVSPQPYPYGGATTPQTVQSVSQEQLLKQPSKPNKRDVNKIQKEESHSIDSNEKIVNPKEELETEMTDFIDDDETDISDAAFNAMAGW